MFALPTETLVELSRWQFALTAMYHFIMESVYVMTGKEI
jgi:cytochrome d ubiquinol oxidase subunit I